MRKTWIKKINRGLILFVVLLLGVIIYHASVFAAQQPLRNEARGVIERFYSVTTEAINLPAEYSDINSKISEDLINAKNEKFKSDIRQLCSAKNEFYDDICLSMESKLRDQKNNILRVTGIEVQDLKVTAFETKNDIAKVMVSYKSSGSSERFNFGDSYKDEYGYYGTFRAEFLLRLEDDQWRIRDYTENSYSPFS